MRSLELIPRRWLEYEPPSSCHEPITTTIAALGIGEAVGGAGAALGATAAAEGVAGVGAAAAGTAAAGASWLPSLGTIGTVAGGVGSLISAKASMDNADYQAAVARSEAAALKQKANEDAAAAERAAITQGKKTELVQSRLRALAADSGTDATSPDILATSGRIAEQGAYNAQSTLYEGLARSRSDTAQADIDLFKAKQIGRAAPLAAAGTILSGISSFADRRLTRRLYAAGGDANFGFGAL